MDELRECRTPSDVGRSLKQDLSGLDDAYMGIWRRILKETPKKARLVETIVLWVVTASRAMRTEELRHAVATCPDTHSFDTTRLVQATQLIDVCLGLLDVEEESRIIRFSRALIFGSTYPLAYLFC
jgi:ankyrin repeat domain-containing protein 50